MWEELETDIKIYAKGSTIFGEGKKDADIMVLFDHPFEEMQNNKQIKATKEYQILKKIFNYVEIDDNKCYYTFLIKYFSSNLVEENLRKESIKYLLDEIYLVNPKYIICVGEDIFNYLYKYYIKNDTNKLVIDISKCVGKAYDFYGILLIPIYDMFKIKSLSYEDKKKMVEILRRVNK